MNATSPFGFARFVPGFDFLQSLAQGAKAGLPPMSQWVAPTMSVEEIERRIQEFKTVQFWLEQNARALSATVQALEVQRMTLATLKDMNVAVGDMASAMAGTPAASAKRGRAKAAPAEPAAEGAAAAGAGSVDPLQWWGALTQQFQQIAAQATKDAPAPQAAFAASQDMATQAFKAAGEMAQQWATQAMAPTQTDAAAKPARKPAGKRSAPPASRSKRKT